MAGMLFANLLIIRIKEISEILIIGRVIGHEFSENKGLEEPARVRQVPFHRARIWHRLQHTIVSAEGSREGFGVFADPQIARPDFVRV